MVNLVSRRISLALAFASLSLGAGQALAAPVVVYDSSSVYLWNTPNPVATSGYNGNITTHDTLAYKANSIVEAGGEIQLAGTERLASSATVQFRTGPNGSAAISDSVQFTLNFYADNAGLIGALLGSQSVTVTTPAGTGTTKGTQRPFFDVTFNLASLDLALPNSVFYGVSFNPDQSVTTNSLNISLWNYGTADGYPTTDADYDGAVIKTGTDLSHTYWYKNSDGTYGSFAGFTPNLTLSAVQVPEPGSLALGGVGLLALVLARRRRSAVAVHAA